MNRHQEFYATFVQLYDSLFPLQQATVEILNAQLQAVNARCVLDIGCGSGSLALALRTRGYRVDAIDSSAEMVAVAVNKEQQHRSAESGKFVTASMQSLDRSADWPDASYDAVLCLGNTLAHAESGAAVRRVCAAVQRLLRPLGVFIVQGIDFDVVQQRAVRELPLIETDDYRLIRRYGERTAAELIPFHISIVPLASSAPGHALEATTALYALGWKQLKQILIETGFGCVERSVSLLGTNQRDGLELVVTARAGAA
ncbi:MAG: class I SAM-dependent methyltransferase [Spirochaetaceae bacterium]|nr:MAG: class I SAM-dependent methyltransferase [Spirochaetaceae bacterium]